MDDSSVAPSGCAHKFKKMPDGVLRCELCGERREPTPQVDPPGETQKFELSKGAKREILRERLGRFIDRVTDWL